MNIVVGSNLREWRPAGSNTVNVATDPSYTNVWTGTAQASCGGGTAVIDMLTVNMATAGKTLTGLTLTNDGTTGVALVMSGLTIDEAPAKTFTRPGNSGNTPAATHSQAGEHSNSANFTGQSPAQGQSASSANAGLATPATTSKSSDETADKDKHTNRGHR
jgi:hypothetical protein